MTDADRKALANFPIEVWNVDEQIGDFRSEKNDPIQLNAPATIDVRYLDSNGNPQQKWLFYEYPPVLDIMESIYTLSYLKKYPAALPGRVPWEMFELEEMKNLLERIHWQIAIEK